MKPMIKYIFLELTNFCNFNCTFCPNAVMTRKREFMDKGLAVRLLDEIAGKNLAEEPIQLHLMGEPLLHPHIFEILEFMRQKNLPVRLFTNGALLNEKYRERIYATDIQELVIGIQTHNEQTYRDHRRGKPDFQTYMKNIRDMVEAKFAKNLKMQIEMHYMNTKHFNEFRIGKNYPQTRFPLVDSNEKALAIIDEWKNFGRAVSKKYGLNHEPLDLAGLQGSYKSDPLACVRDNHCQILPGVILSFKELNTFCDYLVNPIKYVERHKSNCNSISEQFAVLANGDCTLCCVDYDGKMAVGDAKSHGVESIWTSKKVRKMQSINRQGLFPTQVCRICRAFQVVDDYKKKFPGREGEPYELVHGWYPLESDGKNQYRWIGKRAVLVLKKNAKHLEVLIKQGHPRSETTKIFMHQGKRKKAYNLKNKDFSEIRFALKDIKRHGAEIVLESEEFWIPAEIFPSSDDRRELSVMVKEANLKF